MTITSDFPLKKYNTFGIDASARQFVAVQSASELRDVLLSNSDREKFILGGGSNMLLTRDVEALVIHVDLKGIEVLSRSEDAVVVKAMAGENWHEFVLYTIDKGFGGLENLSLIPGNVGTTPIQNIGAYGVEIKDCFVSCEAMDIETGEIKVFSLDECRFGYRESIFKQELRNKYVIVSVSFRLSVKDHKIHTEYGDIKAELARNNIHTPTIKDVSNAVIAIRQSKLPDPKVLGNCGSFFKNPVISREQFDLIQKKFPDIRHFPVSDTQVKVPAGWLIEQAGFKGCRFGDAGVHKNQALVLVNYGSASGSEILELSQKIQAKVFDIYGIRIEAEVNII